MARKSIQYTMRALHRDIGFFVIGLTLIYCISGAVLVFRGTDFLKREVLTEKTLPAGLDGRGVAKELRMRRFDVQREDAQTLTFQNGSYDKLTGDVQYTSQELPALLSKFNRFHKIANDNAMSWFAILYAALLLFLAISSLWMYAPRSKPFRRGIILTVAGIVFSALILLLV